ncbi:hypothetical protein AMAG_19323 [Allomyces macrogynus ATCC 38327]|uniref:FHA domain-containing protein n=1 Tax=Allomyces macrogynus (strain ATCC 38327) TaxID=578462 RepID=A0A0L0SU17_ALLM3|nr:hypothetical protein AMAG_19323 [Allomyces macrogynus ATCC 38327]|eukprot:KNE66043.1 hypothetical protein AMAG_19323 [Allomyces macrogynus ATCC 38327]
MAEHAGAGSHAAAGNGAPAAEPAPTIRFIPYITDLHRGLNFPIVERKVPNGKVLKVKRFVEKGNVDFSDSIAFKSKVVSRQHGEIWTQGRKFFFRDTKSSSGTFINNVRIAPANSESPPIELHDGDIIQLGVDYQGRTEDIFRCVRIRIEVNREPYRNTAFRSLGVDYQGRTEDIFRCVRIRIEVNREPYRNTAFRGQVVKALRAFAAATDTGDCCICLGPIAPFQALFIAPCCHTFHYKCSRPLLNTWPTFSCPLCRHYADLNASVSVENLSEFNDLDAEVPASPTGPGAASPPPEPSAHASNEHITSPLPNAATANPPDEHLGAGHATAGPAKSLARAVAGAPARQGAAVGPEGRTEQSESERREFSATLDALIDQEGFAFLDRYARACRKPGLASIADGRVTHGPQPAPPASLASYADLYRQACDHWTHWLPAEGEVIKASMEVDDELAIFHDIRPAAQLHLLVVPVAHIKNINHLDATHVPMRSCFRLRGAAAVQSSLTPSPLL